MKLKKFIKFLCFSFLFIVLLFIFAVKVKPEIKTNGRLMFPYSNKGNIYISNDTFDIFNKNSNINGKVYFSLYNNFYNVINLIPAINIEIDKKVSNLFKNNPNKKKELEIIKQKLLKSVWAVIQDDYNSNLIVNKDLKPTKEIIKSWDKLKASFIYNLHKIIVIFDFSESVENYYTTMINARPEGMRYLRLSDVKAIDGAAMTNCKNTIWIFNTFEEKFKYRSFIFKSKLGITYNVGDYFIGSDGNYYEKEKDEFFKNWTEEKPKTGSLNSVIFHELTHMALFLSNNKEVQSRYADEATVEDITMKIYTKDCTNCYETAYQILLYSLNELNKGELISRVWGMEYDMDTNNFCYIRRFNPPKNIKYEIGNTFGGILFWADGSWADDCRDENMKPYIFPILLLSIKK